MIRGRPLRTVLALVLAAGVVASATWLVFFSSVLGVREIVIVGNLTVSRERIEEAAGVPYEHPLATVDLEDVEEKVGSIRQIESVSAARQWPGTLRIEVVERTPVAVVLAGGKAALMDRDGVVTEVRDAAPPTLPVLVVDRPSSTDPATRAALQVIADLPGDIAGLVEEVRATTAEGVSLVFGDGRVVVWGGTDRPREKARILATLLERKAKTYDVSSPEVVTVR